jgi:hypothetical protein
VLRAMASTMAWGADLIAARSRGSKRAVFYVDLSGPSEVLPKGWDFLGLVQGEWLIQEIAELIYQFYEYRIDGLLHAAIEYKEGPVSDAESELLSLCWCREHEADGCQPFYLILKREGLERTWRKFGSLTNPDLIAIAREATVAFDLDAGQNLDRSPLAADFGVPGSDEWFKRVESVTRKYHQKRIETEARATALSEQSARRQEQRIARIKLVVADLERLVNKYGARIPCSYLAHLPKTPRPVPGPLSDAILLSWDACGGNVPNVAVPANLHWPGSLFLLHWVMKGQASEVLHSLAQCGHPGKNVIRRIERMVDAAKEDLQRGFGGGSGGPIWFGIRRAWISLIPPGWQG